MLIINAVAGRVCGCYRVTSRNRYTRLLVLHSEILREWVAAAVVVADQRAGLMEAAEG
jgi:hypothetical protein